MREYHVFARFGQNLSWGTEALWGRKAGGVDFPHAGDGVGMTVWTCEKRSAVRSPTQRVAMTYAVRCDG